MDQDIPIPTIEVSIPTVEPAPRRGRRKVIRTASEEAQFKEQQRINRNEAAQRRRNKKHHEMRELQYSLMAQKSRLEGQLKAQVAAREEANRFKSPSSQEHTVEEWLAMLERGLAAEEEEEDDNGDDDERAAWEARNAAWDAELRDLDAEEVAVKARLAALKAENKALNASRPLPSPSSSSSSELFPSAGSLLRPEQRRNEANAADPPASARPWSLSSASPEFLEKERCYLERIRRAEEEVEKARKEAHEAYAAGYKAGKADAAEWRAPPSSTRHTPAYTSVESLLRRERAMKAAKVSSPASIHPTSSTSRKQSAIERAETVIDEAEKALAATSQEASTSPPEPDYTSAESLFRLERNLNAAIASSAARTASTPSSSTPLLNPRDTSTRPAGSRPLATALARLDPHASTYRSPYAKPPQPTGPPSSSSPLPHDPSRSRPSLHPYGAATSSNPYPPATSSRPSAPKQACAICRQRKVRCDPGLSDDSGDGKCARCLIEGKGCHYPGMKRKRGLSSPDGDGDVM
ncbi:MAG: hypothetical protein M1819_001745 [Sarea resinae]|nr:MAG: hypothetical protein M1819_001745 [Sarea resinae]